MNTPLRNRVPLGDITSSSNANVPRHASSQPALKRSPPSPFSPGLRATSSAELRRVSGPRKRVLTSADVEQRPHLEALWAVAYPPRSAAQLEAEHARRLQAVIDFANVERSYLA